MKIQERKRSKVAFLTLHSPLGFSHWHQQLQGQHHEPQVTLSAELDQHQQQRAVQYSLDPVKKVSMLLQASLFVQLIYCSLHGFICTLCTDQFVTSIQRVLHGMRRLKNFFLVGGELRLQIDQCITYNHTIPKYMYRILLNKSQSYQAPMTLYFSITTCNPLLCLHGFICMLHYIQYMY